MSVMGEKQPKIPSLGTFSEKNNYAKVPGTWNFRTASTFSRPSFFIKNTMSSKVIQGQFWVKTPSFGTFSAKTLHVKVAQLSFCRIASISMTATFFIKTAVSSKVVQGQLFGQKCILLVLKNEQFMRIESWLIALSTQFYFTVTLFKYLTSFDPYGTFQGMVRSTFWIHILICNNPPRLQTVLSIMCIK